MGDRDLGGWGNSGGVGKQPPVRDALEFTDVVRRSYGAVYLTALAIVSDPDTAEDIAQETFLRAWLRINTLRDAALVEPWLGRIVRNVAAQWLRTGQQRSQVLPLISMEEITVEPVDERGDDPRRAAQRTEEQGQLTQAVMALPEEMRQAVLLHYAEGMSPSEIARLNGEAASTVTRRLERARQILREHLENGLPVSLAASLQGLRPGSRRLEKSLAFIAAATTLPAASRANLLQLTSDTPAPPATDTVISAATAASSKDISIMNGIFANAGAVKLLAMGAGAAAILAGGAIAVTSLSTDAVSPVHRSVDRSTRISSAETKVQTARAASSNRAGGFSLPRSNAGVNPSSSGRANRLSTEERVALLKSDLISTQPELVVLPGETTGTVHLDLQVVNDSGLPVQGATVRVPEYGFNPGAFIGSFQRPKAEVHDFLTNRYGIARVSVPVGEPGPFKTSRLTAEASHPDYAPTREEMAFTSITRLVLTAGATLEISVVDGATSTPILSDVIPEFDSHFMPDWYTRPDGTIAVWKLGESKAEFYLHRTDAAGKRWVSEVQTVKLPYKASAPLQVVLNPTVTIKGSLDPIVPRPVQDVKIHTSYQLSRRSPLGYTTGTIDVNPDGTFEIPDILVGKTLHVAALGDSYYSQPPTGSRKGQFIHPIRISAVSQHHVVPMAKAATAIVRLQDADGKAVTSATVESVVSYNGLIRLIPEDGIVTDEKGVAIIENLPPVEGLRVKVAHDQWQLHIVEGSRNFGGEKSLDMSAGGIVEHDITLVRKPRFDYANEKQTFMIPEGCTLTYTFPPGGTAPPE